MDNGVARHLFRGYFLPSIPYLPFFSFFHSFFLYPHISRAKSRLKCRGLGSAVRKLSRGRQPQTHYWCIAMYMQCSICRGVGVGGFNPPLVEDDPLTGDCKVWSGPSKVKKYEFVIRRVYIPHVFSSLHTTDHRRSQGAVAMFRPI